LSSFARLWMWRKAGFFSSVARLKMMGTSATRVEPKMK
jgi:hypothetical protein